MIFFFFFKGLILGRSLVNSRLLGLSRTENFHYLVYLDFKMLDCSVYFAHSSEERKTKDVQKKCRQHYFFVCQRIKENPTLQSCNGECQFWKAEMEMFVAGQANRT